MSGARNTASLSLIFVAMFAVGVQPSWARSDEVPDLHVEQLCRGIASQSSDPMAENYPAVSFERCMQAEREDRDQLQKQWATYTSEQKLHCIAEASAGGSSSYTELLTCLEMAQIVKELRQSSPNGGYESPVSR
jgi:hypothetical protein